MSLTEIVILPETIKIQRYAECIGCGTKRPSEPKLFGFFSRFDKFTDLFDCGCDHWDHPKKKSSQSVKIVRVAIKKVGT